MKMHLCLKGTLVAMSEKNVLRRKGGKQCIYTHRVTQILLTTNREITPRASRGPTVSSADFVIHNH